MLTMSQALQLINPTYLDLTLDPATKRIIGPKGDTGKAATVKIGTVRTGTTASVQNVGTETNAILNFILPRGEQGSRGEQGLKGEKGDQGPKGDTGPIGKNAIIKIGNISASQDGLLHIQSRDEEHSDHTETFLDFYMPPSILTGGKGADGKDGITPTIKIGSVTYGDTPYVTNSGTGTDIVLDFVLPRASSSSSSSSEGMAVFPVVRVGEVTTAAPGTNAAVYMNEYKDGAEIAFDFVIPRGADGNGLDTSGLTNITKFGVGSVRTGQYPAVTNVGKDGNVLLDFVLPRGEKGIAGPQGNPGKAATIKIGNTTTGSVASVRNVGTENDAILEFTLPVSNTGTSTGITTAQVKANNVIFSDGESLQTKLNAKTIGAALFSSAVTVDMSSIATAASASISGEGSINDPYALSLTLPKVTQGTPGTAATVKVGRVEQSGTKVKIVNSGTANAAVLDFTFPASWGNTSSGNSGSSSSGSSGSSSSGTTVVNNSIEGLQSNDDQVQLTVDSFTPDTAGDGSVGTYQLPFGTAFFQHFVLGGVPLEQREIYTISDTFTVPKDVHLIYISACAGGGGGGIGYGGGGGESIYRQALQVTPGAQLKLTIGSGGQGYATRLSDFKPPNNWNGNGQNGKDTIIGTYITLRGGKGGKFNYGTQEFGGEAGGYGSSHGNSISLVLSNDDTMIWAGGSGGNSMFGSGGAGGIPNLSQAPTKAFSGSSGVGFGSGGGGGALVWEAGDKQYWNGFIAGSGAPGIVIIEWE